MNFDVLSRHVNLNKHILVEASAGTGKTFTIEHLFLRRLITPNEQGSYLRASDLAILTFTKAVARELVLRLRRALEKGLSELRSPEISATDYIQAIKEKGLQEEAAARLEIASEELYSSCIGTIHSFCYRTQTEYANDNNDEEEERWASSYQLQELILEFFRTKLSCDPCTQEAVKVLLQSQRHDFSALVNEVYTGLWQESKDEILDFTTIFEAIEKLPKQGLDPDGIYKALEALSYNYKGLRAKDGELKYEASFRAFAALFSQPLTLELLAKSIKDPLIFSELFNEPKVKAKGDASARFAILKPFEPYMRQLGSKDLQLLRLTKSCQAFVSAELKKRGLYCERELVERMEEALLDKAFAQYVRKRYSCLIIDEFQDTDPRQWKIMSDLFLSSWQGHIYLVGDPKQAIYAFRNADVYSYMQAKSYPFQDYATLTKNFRSSPDMVAGLNKLFTGPHSSELFYLPKLGISLDVPCVSSAERVENVAGDERAAIHFFVANGSIGKKRSWPTQELQESYLFPFIAEELVKLHSSGFLFHNMAILVKDRHESQSVTSYLKARGIPCASFRKNSVIGSEAHLFLQRLVKALMAPRERSRLIELLIHPPFSYPNSYIEGLFELEAWAKEVALLLSLRADFEKYGLVRLLKRLSESIPMPKDFLRDLEWLVEICSQEARTLHELQEYLQGLSELSESDKDAYCLRIDPDVEAVEILTLHASKGLEFEVVFALGLATRTQEPDGDPQEADAEKMRLVYVACTRAKRRLYLPVANQFEPYEPACGRAAPMELFLQKVGSIEAFSSTHLQPNDSKSLLYQSEQENFYPLVLPEPHYQKDKLSVSSFSRLKLEAVGLSQKEQSLPQGAESGALLHQIISELIPNKENLNREWLKKRLAGTILTDLEECVESLLQRLFQTTLAGVVVRDIDVARTFCEKEFWLAESASRYVRGQIDFIFEHEGKSYIVDWKTNLLEGYTTEYLKQAVAAHEYDLQAAIYSRAWRAHIKDSQLEFGGFFFVFLRGLPDGVLFLEPGEVYG